MCDKNELKNLRTEFNKLPKKGRYDLGGKGIQLLNKIHKLEAKLDKEE